MTPVGAQVFKTLPCTLNLQCEVAKFNRAASLEMTCKLISFVFFIINHTWIFQAQIYLTEIFAFLYYFGPFNTQNILYITSKQSTNEQN